MDTAALRYTILRDIDKVAYSVKHATLIEHVIRTVNKIELVERKCWDSAFLSSLRDSLYKDHTLLICVPPGGSIEKYLYRLNATFVACSDKAASEVFVENLSEVLRSRILGVVAPIMTTELVAQKVLVQYYVWMLMTKIVHPQATSAILVSKRIPTEHLETILKYIPRNGLLLDAVVEFLQTYVLRSLVSKHVLQLRMKQFMLDTVLDQIGSFVLQAAECGAPFQFHLLVDTMKVLAAQPFSYRVWQPLVDALVQVTEVVHKKYHPTAEPNTTQSEVQSHV
jgi:hypothetical protein